MSDLFNFQTQKDEDNTQIIDKEDKEYDFIIPITFPDYEITLLEASNINIDNKTIDLYFFKINTPKINFTIDKIKSDKLGHSGILIANNKGLTKYYEYGRYIKINNKSYGQVRNVAIKNIKVESNIINKESLKEIFWKLGQKYSNAIATIYQKEDSYQTNLEYLKKQQTDLEPDKKTGQNKLNKAYDIFNYSCITFVLDLLKINQVIESSFNNIHPITALRNLMVANNLDIDYIHNANKQISKIKVQNL